MSFVNKADASALLSRPPSYNFGLVSYWTMDGGDYNSASTTAEVLDRSGNNNHGNNTGATGKIGKIGQALEFNGTSNEVILDNNTTFDFSQENAFTLAAWVYPNNTNVSDTVFSRGATFSSANGYAYFLGKLNTNGTRWRIRISDGVNEIDVTSAIGTVSSTTWAHMVVVWNGTSLTLYKDNASLGTATNGSFTGLWDGDSAGDRETSIGADGQGEEDFWDGKLDDVRVYNRALSSFEVAALYRAGNFRTAASSADLDNSSSLSQGLVGHWTMDGIDYNTASTTAEVLNKSGSSFRGNNIGATRTAGKLGQALTFDGSDDYVDVGTGPTSVQTVAFWVYPQTTTEYFINLTGTSDFVWANAGTLTASGFTSPTIYIDGLESSSLVAGKWQHVVVTTGTAENASNLDIGRTADANYLEGRIDDVRFYSRALFSYEVNQLYKLGGGTVNASQNKTGGSLDAGLVGLWSFNGSDYNAASTTAEVLDRSGQNNNGDNSGATRTIGKVGQGLNFDGNDIVTVLETAILDPSQITISMWVKFTSNVLTANNSLIERDSNTGYRIRCAELSPCTPQFVFNSTFGADGISIPLNVWTHLVLVGNSSGTRFYTNAVAGSLDTDAYVASGSGFDVTIGGGALGYFNGQIDEVRIYSRALSDNEITQLYNISK